MDQVNIATGAWVVVCDGGKALILENSGSPAAVKLDTREVREHADAPTHQQGTDRPGRVHQSFGNARSAVEQTDWHDEAERVFLESLARRLDAAIAAGETSDLIIVAAPRALGMLRPAYIRRPSARRCAAKSIRIMSRSRSAKSRNIWPVEGSRR